MSRAAITILLTRTLHHQPTPQEYEEARKLLLQLCPGGRLYIPGEPIQTTLPLNDIRDMSRNGFSVRRIARTLKVSKSAVHKALSTNPVVPVDTQP